MSTRAISCADIAAIAIDEITEKYPDAKIEEELKEDLYDILNMNDMFKPEHCKSFTASVDESMGFPFTLSLCATVDMFHASVWALKVMARNCYINVYPSKEEDGKYVDVQILYSGIWQPGGNANE